MKKSILWLAGAAFSAFIFASCGSTKIAMQEHSPVAVFSIVGNSQVPWTADDPHNPDEAESDGVLSSMVNKLIDGQNPEIVTAVDRLDYADDSIRQIFPEMTGCEIQRPTKTLAQAILIFWHLQKPQLTTKISQQSEQKKQELLWKKSVRNLQSSLTSPSRKNCLKATNGTVISAESLLSRQSCSTAEARKSSTRPMKFRPASEQGFQAINTTKMPLSQLSTRPLTAQSVSLPLNSWEPTRLKLSKL